jgi:hypothetical protein
VNGEPIPLSGTEVRVRRRPAAAGYSKRKGVDFYDSYTSRYIGLTTPSGVSGHKAKAKLKTSKAHTFQNALYRLPKK